MKFLKWILGLFALIGGAIAMFIPKSKNKKVEKIEKKIESSKSVVKGKVEENKAVKKTLEIKKKGSTDAADFLKKYEKNKK